MRLFIVLLFLSGQTVMVQGSPAGKDIVQPIVYDKYGRDHRSYLPVTVDETNGWCKPNPLIIDPATGNYAGIAASFYATSSANKVADDTRPFSETVFEPSPLNRPSKEYGPGAAWGPAANNKFISHGYHINIHGTGESQETIIAWEIDNNGISVRAAPKQNFIEVGGYYSTGQLQIKVTTDEHGNAVREYIDKRGRVILKKVQAIAGAALNNNDHWAQTYYIYDDFGNLAVVLPPEGTKKLWN